LSCKTIAKTGVDKLREKNERHLLNPWLTFKNGMEAFFPPHLRLFVLQGDVNEVKLRQLNNKTNFITRLSWSAQISLKAVQFFNTTMQI
jgi:hypothetical protein